MTDQTNKRSLDELVRGLASGRLSRRVMNGSAESKPER